MSVRCSEDMDAERIAKALGLNAARIVAKASATEDYARILMERAAEDRAAADAWRVRAASAQAIAGSLWMLVRPRRSRRWVTRRRSTTRSVRPTARC